MCTHPRTVAPSKRRHFRVRVARTKRVDRVPLPAPKTRRGGATSQEEAQREASPFSEEVFNSREHYENSKKVFQRSVVHEREQDAYEQTLAEKQGDTLDLTQVLTTIAMPGMRWDSYNPKSERVDNAILTPEARRWQQMIVLISDYAFHCSLATAFDVVPSLEDEYMDIPARDRDCPFGDWRDEKKARKAWRLLYQYAFQRDPRSASTATLKREPTCGRVTLLYMRYGHAFKRSYKEL
ncbi:hypothetical protein PIB30_077763 [Stylosanthes scabra]|uniref:Uncharacterized protein n=1 Tax=Stylosanthes scabra TaxID=79078 RepID=A0ABU6SS50_9FABA|nr:hypothetical protein [Stylosanthes scabra]